MAKRYQDLIAWQIADELRREIVQITASGNVTRDCKFCSQIRDSSRSVSANIAEGFARFSHRDFARFLVIARGSLVETEVHLRDCVDRGYLEPAEHSRLALLARRAMVALTRLLTYLRTHRDRC
jgi:four helix bundle protein